MSSQTWYPNAISAVIWADVTRNGLMFSWEITTFLYFFSLQSFHLFSIVSTGTDFFPSVLVTKSQSNGRKRFFFLPCVLFQIMLEISSGEWQTTLFPEQSPHPQKMLWELVLDATSTFTLCCTLYCQCFCCFSFQPYDSTMLSVVPLMYRNTYKKREKLINFWLQVWVTIRQQQNPVCFLLPWSVVCEKGDDFKGAEGLLFSWTLTVCCESFACCICSGAGDWIPPQPPHSGFG